MEDFIKKKVRWQKTYDSRLCRYFSHIGMFEVCVIPDTPTRKFSEMTVKSNGDYIGTFVNENGPFTWAWVNKTIKKFFNSNKLEKWMNS